MKIAAVELQKQLRGVPGLLAVEDDLPFGKEDILLELKPEGEAMGFSAEDVARQVRNSFSGSVAKRFAEDTEEIIVRVKLPAAETKQQTIRDVYLRSPDKTDVLLSEVVTLTKRLGFTRINREDGVTQVSVTGDVDPSVTTTNTVLAIVSQEIAPAIEKQFGVKVEFKGKAEEQAEALGDLSIALILSIASIYIILAWLFSSYTTPLVIMSVVPFGLVGAIVGHYLMDFNLNMFSLMALLGLSGVLVNDSIILVTTIKRFIADGLDLAQAVAEGVRERLRPVLLTTITTVVGLTPILFEQSLQAQLVQPLAITFIFGMMLAPYLVLIFVPSVLGVGDSLKNKFSLLMLQTGFRKTTI
jgi:multidrug efflux pump subunit AcrB